MKAQDVNAAVARVVHVICVHTVSTVRPVKAQYVQIALVANKTSEMVYLW